MTVALRNLNCSYTRMRHLYCGMACGRNLQLQLRLFGALVTSSALFGAEVWGDRSSTGRQRKKFASLCQAIVWATEQYPYGVFPVKISLAVSA